MEWLTPRSPTQVRAFLDLCNYLSNYIPRYAEKAVPRYRLTEKGQLFVWTLEAQSAFEALKIALSSPPVLAFPRVCKKNYEEVNLQKVNKNEGIYIVDYDASLQAAGGILNQVQDGRERIIAYHSHAFSKQERNFCTTRLELAAILIMIKVWAVYLEHRKFIVRTDHSALQWLRSLKNFEQQLFRWLAYLESFDFVVLHRRGTFHTGPDSLSRRPCPDDCRHCKRKEDKDAILEEVDVVHANRLFLPEQEFLKTARARIVSDSPWDDSSLRTAQENDPDIGPLLALKHIGETPDREAYSDASATTKCLIQQWDILGILHREWYEANGQV